ncbi:RNA-directed DNA polymerase, eukaryota, reverse transcriptase zinc-binding domain protein [Tanacetum coccineum]
MDFRIASWNIKGMCKESKQNELKKFIAEEKIHVCAILETQLKTKNISKACDYVFGRWRWVSNVAHSPTSCRIVVGWKAGEVDVMVVQRCSQTVLCLVEIVQTKVKLFVSFVYASLPLQSVIVYLKFRGRIKFQVNRLQCSTTCDVMMYMHSSLIQIKNHCQLCSITDNIAAYLTPMKYILHTLSNALHL